MAEPLETLFALPVPEQAVILARGPSLGLYSPARHPAAVGFGVNDLGIHRKGQTHDDHRIDYSVYIDGAILGEYEMLGNPIRPQRWKDQVDGRGYWWHFGRDTQELRDAFGRTGSAAMMIPWMWGCRDIWIYGMDAFPNCNGGKSAISGVVNPHDTYAPTVQNQKRAIDHFGITGVHWAHLEDASD